MKRIANDVALRTVSYLLPGTQFIRIVDYHSDNALLWRTGGDIVFEGCLGEAAYNYKFSKYFDSKLHGIKFDENEKSSLIMVFELATDFEQYK